MRNYVQPGETITLITPAGIRSGDVVQVGALIGVAAYDAPEGAEVEVSLVGVYDLPKGNAALEQGALAFWDAGSKTVAGSGVLLGAVILPAGADAATCRVRLNGVTS
jgi:predicted RecA/RadA family phage recombinase